MLINPYQSPRLREKKRKQRKIQIILGSIIFIILFVGFVYLSNSDSLRIQRIIVNDLNFSDRNEIENIIKEQIEGRYFGLFLKSNIFIFPRAKIERKIKTTYSSISYINIDAKGLHTISLEIEEFQPSAKWCDVPVTPALNPNHVNDENISAIPQTLNSYSGQCYLMTSDGMIFAKDNNLEGDFIKTFGFITSDPLRQKYSDSKTFRDLIDFVKLLRRLNIEANEVWTTDGEVYAVVTKEKVKIYIDGEDDIVSVFNNLQTVIERDAINKAQFANIDYIDLRFGNRVFYKLK